MQKHVNKTSRTKVKRLKERASYDLDEIYAVLDQAFYATIAFSDEKNIHAIPMAIWREDQHLYVHGSYGSRLMQILKSGKQVCISVTHIHGLVLARSAIKHSMNYSSVSIYGSFEQVSEESKRQHMKNFLEHWMPGRWQYTRIPDKKELAATMILQIPLIEAVLKARSGQATDYPEDMQQAVWSGIAPLAQQWQQPIQSPEQNQENFPGLYLRNLNQ